MAGKTRRTFTQDHKIHAVKRAMELGSVRHAAAELGINESLLSRWVSAARKSPPSAMVTEDIAPRGLQEENARLRMERDQARLDVKALLHTVKLLMQ